MELIAKGAESNLFKDNGILIKERSKKKYRINEIDNKLRKKRTLSEGKILMKLKNEVNVPEVMKVDEKEFKIFMKFINGKLLKDLLSEQKIEDERLKNICVNLGIQIGKMHKLNVIHNDLTTSNIIVNENDVYIIDFGLSYVSERIEDKATDLVVLEHSLNVIGFEYLFAYIIEGYKTYEECDKILEQTKKVKKRVRYFEEED